MTALVELEGVVKRFGRREALADVSLEVGTGEIVGLAGPNGSGKTTLLRLLAGLTRPTRGRVRVFGLDPSERRERVMEHARFAFAPPALYDSLRAREHLRYLAGLGGTNTVEASVDEALERVGLADRAQDRVGTFSFGMRQRLILAQALLPRPRLLVLDEPADGLDPLAVLELRGILARLREELEVTILLSSHLLLELDQLVDRLLVLDQGRSLFQGTPAELRGEGAVVRIRVDDPATGRELLVGAGLDARAGEDGALEVAGEAPSLERVREILAGGEVELCEYALDRPTLEAALIRRLAGDVSR